MKISEFEIPTGHTLAEQNLYATAQRQRMVGLAFHPKPRNLNDCKQC